MSYGSAISVPSASLTVTLLAAEVESGELTVDRADVVEASVAVKADAVITRPLLRTRQAQAELLAADQLRFRRDADDLEAVGVLGQVDGGEQPAVAEPGDDDSASGHVAFLQEERRSLPSGDHD